MVSKTGSSKDWKVTSFRIERQWVDLARYLKISLPDATVKGIRFVAKERIHDLSEQQIAFLAQHHRSRIESHQEEVMTLERIGFDARIREEQRKGQKYITEIWDGKEVIIGVSE